jgi:hypothetical protein
MWTAMKLSYNSEEGSDEMKKAFGISTMLTLVLLLTAASSVYAQSQRIRINIPFSFAVGQKSFPAGEYTVEPNTKNSLNVWLLEGEQGKDAIVFTTNSVRSGRNNEESKLVFAKYGDQYFLSQVWTAGDQNGRELNVTSSEKQLVQNGIRRETVVLASGN